MHYLENEKLICFTIKSSTHKDGLTIGILTNIRQNLCFELFNELDHNSIQNVDNATQNEKKN